MDQTFIPGYMYVTKNQILRCRLHFMTLWCKYRCLDGLFLIIECISLDGGLEA